MDIEWSWLAGIIDGEGTVTFSRRRSNENRIPVVSVASTTPEILIRCHRIAGGTITNKRVTRRHHKTSQAWNVSGLRALHVLEYLVPLMTEPEKIRRAKLLLAEYRNTVSRNGKYTTAQIEAKQRLETEFFQNSKKVA